MLNKSEIKKQLKKLNDQKLKKNISGLIGKPTKPVNWVT
jgi:hypothetical protein